VAIHGGTWAGIATRIMVMVTVLGQEVALRYHGIPWRGCWNSKTATMCNEDEHVQVQVQVQCSSRTRGTNERASSSLSRIN
jgi:hypothetical protein